MKGPGGREPGRAAAPTRASPGPAPGSAERPEQRGRRPGKSDKGTGGRRTLRRSRYFGKFRGPVGGSAARGLESAERLEFPRQHLPGSGGRVTARPRARAGRSAVTLNSDARRWGWGWSCGLSDPRGSPLEGVFSRRRPLAAAHPREDSPNPGQRREHEPPRPSVPGVLGGERRRCSRVGCGSNAAWGDCRKLWAAPVS